jgi:outer membrane protein OmpA-like peptidoglycan-associated protein
VGSAEDLLDLQASVAKDTYVEKRIRLISEERAEVIFLFGEGRSATAKRLGLPRVLVFDFGAGMSFDLNQFAIQPRFMELLERQAKQLTTQFAALDVYVCGHTDTSGSAETNLPLSLNRAQSVADALAARGVAKARLKIQGLGSEFPVVANDTPENRAINRRTEIILPQ